MQCNENQGLLLSIGYRKKKNLFLLLLLTITIATQFFSSLSLKRRNDSG
jgi:hypothetical protein